MVVGISVACQGNFYWSFTCLLPSQLLPVSFSAPSLRIEQFLLQLTEGSLAIFVVGYAVPKVTLGSALLPPAADQGIYPNKAVLSQSRVC